MAEEQNSSSATAVAEKPAELHIPGPIAAATDAVANIASDVVKAKDKKDKQKTKKGKDKKGAEDETEYELEFETPFGKIELEFEPKERKAKKDKQRRDKAEKEAAKAAAQKAQMLAEKQASRGGGPSRTLIVLLVLGLIAVGTIVAIWLFARPGEDEPDMVPDEFLNEPEPQPASLMSRARNRVRDAVRSGRRASREAQDEQMRKFEDLKQR